MKTKQVQFLSAMAEIALFAATASAAPKVATSANGADAKPFRLPVPLVWQVDCKTLSRRQYLKDIDYLREHTRADLLQLAPVEGIMPEDADQFHDPVKELVEYARSQGFRVILRTSPGLKGVMPRMDVLVVFGEFAHFNWLPDGEAARSQWDVNGSQHVMAKADEIWKAGYRCALVPDRMIEEGRITFEDGKFLVHPGKAYASKEPDTPVAFDKCVFLYPRYARKGTFAFLDDAATKGAALAVVGPADRDFDNDPASFAGRHFAEWSIDVLDAIGCAKSAIPGGAVYDDGSFALVSHGILDGAPTEFDFVLDGVRYSGRHTGILACRNGEPLVMTPGGELHVGD